jgi:hypothetical protein
MWKPLSGYGVEMKLSEIHKRFKTISTYYGGQPPLSVLMGITNLPKEDTMSIWKEYMEGLPEDQKPTPRKRGPKPKTTVKKPRVKKEVQTPPIVIKEEVPIPVVTVEPEPIPTPQPEPVKESWLSILLEKTKVIVYLILVTVEVAVSALAMWSLGHNTTMSFILSIIGISVSILAIYLFLNGINSKGFTKWINIFAWGIYVILFTLLNWSWTIGNLVQENNSFNYQELAKESDKKEYLANLERIDNLTARLTNMNQWATESIKVVQEQVNTLRAQNDEIRKRLEAPVEVKSKGTFDTMGSLFEGNSDLTAKFWWLSAFLLLEFFTVLVAPRKRT